MKLNLENKHRASEDHIRSPHNGQNGAKTTSFFFVLFSICLRIDSLNEKQLVARSSDGNKQCFYTITWMHLCIDCQFRLIQKNGVIAIKKNRKMSLFTFLVYDFINNDIVKKSINNTFDTCFFGFSSFFSSICCSLYASLQFRIRF